MLQFFISLFESFHRRGLAEISGPITWPQHSHALTLPYYFYEYIKAAVYILPLPTILPKCVWRIPAAVATVTPAMSTDILTELDYKYKNCWASPGAHIANE